MNKIYTEICHNEIIEHQHEEITLKATQREKKWPIKGQQLD